MAGIAAYLLLRKKEAEVAKKAHDRRGRSSAWSSRCCALPDRPRARQQVARTQPEKFAAIEGLYTTQTGAPLVMFAVPVAKTARS